MTALTLDAVSVAFDGTTVVRDVDLDVGDGEFVGLVGPNGAGKTTVLGAVAGTVSYSGRITLDGRDISAVSRSERARRVALVPQRPTAPAGMSVSDYVLLGRTPHLGFLANETQRDFEAARTALVSLDAFDLARRELTTLSGGEFQRVVMARSLAQGAPLLLLDEPTSSLDVGHAQRVLAMVDAMRRSCGLTVIAAVHDLTLAAQFCDRLVMLAGGEVVGHGAPATVLTESSIAAHYGATVRVLDDGDGRVVVIPTRTHDSHPTELARGAP